VLLPLFSCPSRQSWGIGEIADLEHVAAWLAGAGQRILQILPLNAMAPGEQSPYSSLSAMAIDPIYISPRRVPECALDGEAFLSRVDREALAEARLSPTVQYTTVRRLKDHVLLRAFERFYTAEWQRETKRAEAFRSFREAEAWWLDDFSLFRALHNREESRPWSAWSAPLRDRDPEALAAARRSLDLEILFHQYLQWLAGSQWAEARTCAHSYGVAIYGDLPFMVDGNSADVWAHQQDFHLDRSVGVPPDAFSATGQDWGMPAYRWTTVADEGFSWLRARARRSAALYDGYRVDHLVGFYRTYSRARDGSDPSFEPDEEAAQRSLGERVLSVLREPGTDLIAEDLGVVPDFVRESLARIDVPGLRVFRWERLWKLDGQPFRDPAGYPAVSVAISGTHDTETMAVWWEHAPEDERAQISAIPTVQQVSHGVDLSRAPFNPTVRDALLEALEASASNLVLIPFQDLFGWTDRINEPATVSPDNWAYKLPWPSDDLPDVPEARECQKRLHEWAVRYRRSPARKPD
jgi:4-alpha-glucanotransferase